ncbi:MAG: hypothetical protein QM488_16500 [Rhizobiaceae bacterium]
MKDRSPVILVSGLKKIAEAGGLVEIVSEVDAEKNGSTWTGEWYVYGTDPENSERFLLVQHINIEPRIIKTAIGVISFCHSIGFKSAVVPLFKGETATLQNANNTTKTTI